MNDKSNIKLLFRSPNTLQLFSHLTCYHNYFKSKFKQKFITFQIYWALSQDISLKIIDMLNVVLWIQNSIDQITNTKIEHCWKKAGLFEDVEGTDNNVFVDATSRDEIDGDFVSY